MSILNDAKLEAFLDALHAQSEGQGDAINTYFTRRIQDGTLSWDGFDAETTTFFADKMVALEKDKAEYCYALCRAMNAKGVVECGTSFGVSTLYLATEWEAAKARVARQNFEIANLTPYIDLREGDLSETLKTIAGPVDFVLLDIWTEAVMPAIRNIAPHLHSGSVIIADNTVSSRRGYEAYFAYIADAKNGLRTMTLPFAGGLEMTIKL